MKHDFHGHQLGKRRWFDQGIGRFCIKDRACLILDHQGLLCLGVEQRILRTCYGNRCKHYCDAKGSDTEWPGRKVF